MDGWPESTVADFLCDPALDPPIPNIDRRLSQLISSGRILHYQRNGTRTVVDSEEFSIQAGDFLFVAESCATGSSHTVITGLSNLKHVFVMADNPGDRFASEARGFYSPLPDTRVISETPGTLVDLVRRIHSGCDITAPIGQVLIVTHANEIGLLFPANDTDTVDEMTDYDELDAYINDSDQLQISARVLGNSAAVHIKGCKIGRENFYLGKIRQLFGGQVLVTAPKHLDTYMTDERIVRRGRRIVERTTYRIEYMLYSFKVFSQRRRRNRSPLSRLFEAATLTDIHNDGISARQWRSWIPSDIHQRNAVRRFPCEIPIDRMTVSRSYRYRNREIYTTGVQYPQGEEPPRTRAERFELLRDDMARNPKMSAAHPYPMYRRFGYGTYDEFVDQVNWTRPSWNRNNRILSMSASRYEYEIRIPITGPNRGQTRLVLNAYLDSGAQEDFQYLHHDLLETDERFFGMMPPKDARKG